MKENGRLAVRLAAAVVADVLVFNGLLMLSRRRTMAGRLIVATAAGQLASTAAWKGLEKLQRGRGGKKNIAQPVGRKHWSVWIAVLAFSCVNVCLWESAAQSLPELLKPTSDVVLYAFGHMAHTRLAERDREKGLFWSGYSRFVRGAVRAAKEPYKVVGELPEAQRPVVYVCRHGNLHGPVTTLYSIGRDIHPMVLAPFFSHKACIEHFSEFTFTKRFGMKKWQALPLAALSSVPVVPLMHSMQAIPVHRNSKAITTLKTAQRYLQCGQSVIVFPDVQYTEKEGDGDIYSGFLALGRMYMKSTGQPLEFVPLAIDDSERCIYIGEGLQWDGSRTMDEAAAVLRSRIHCDAVAG